MKSINKNSHSHPEKKLIYSYKMPGQLFQKFMCARLLYFAGKKIKKYKSRDPQSPALYL